MPICEVCKGERGESKLRRMVAPDDPKIHGMLVCDKCWDWSVDAFKKIEKIVLGEN